MYLCVQIIGKQPTSHSHLSMTTNGQWLQMNITRVALAPADTAARLTVLPVSGSSNCRVQTHDVNHRVHIGHAGTESWQAQLQMLVTNVVQIGLISCCHLAMLGIPTCRLLWEFNTLACFSWRVRGRFTVQPEGSGGVGEKARLIFHPQPPYPRCTSLSREFTAELHSGL